jgi:hypothetical protein
MLVLSAPVSAQTRVAGGYQFQQESFGESNRNFPAGAGVDIQQTIADGWSVVGNIDFSRRATKGDASGTTGGTTWTGVLTSTYTFTTFAAGVRWAPLPEAATSPYVHALVGGTRVSNAVGFVPLVVSS